MDIRVRRFRSRASDVVRGGSPGLWGIGWLGIFIVAVSLSCAGEEGEEPAAGPLSLPAPVEHLAGVAVREPMVVEHPRGHLFVAGFSQAMEESGQPPKLFRSANGGATWTSVPVGTPDQGAVGNSDVDLTVDPDGTLYFLTMGFDRTLGEGTHVAVGVSRDVGQTWRWTYLSRDRFVDRPWIDVAPDGVVHVIWNDGQGVRHAVSTDAGDTWTERPRIHPVGGSSHLAVGPAGEIAVRVTPLSASGNRYDEGVDLIAVSVDGGRTWKKLTPPGERGWGRGPSDPELLPRWVEPLAWDAAGSLYYLWSRGPELLLGRSWDLGETWESWTVFSGDDPLYFPYLAAGADGKLAATWFSGFGESLRANLALVQVRDGLPPTVRRAAPFRIDVWRETGEARLRDPGGEYFPVLFLSGGDLGLVAPVQNALENRLGFSWYRVSY